jgi:hypothetical protein
LRRRQGIARGSTTRPTTPGPSSGYFASSTATSCNFGIFADLGILRYEDTTGCLPLLDDRVMSPVGTFETCRPLLTMSVVGGRPEVLSARPTPKGCEPHSERCATVDFDRGFSASAGKAQCNQHCVEDGRSAIAETSGGAAGESALAPSLCAPIAVCRMACHGWPVVLQARHREQDPGPCSAERCTNASVRAMPCAG